MRDAMRLAVLDALPEISIGALHVRTYVRTNEDPPTFRSNLDLSYRARSQAMDSACDADMPTLADAMDELPDYLRGASQRMGQGRKGPRAEIPLDVRRAIYRRDGWSCGYCYANVDCGDFLVLDHIVPWSAGGSDYSENLRTLCWWCNERRMDLAWDSDIARRIPVTLACSTCCWGEYPTEGIATYCDQCRYITRVPDLSWCA